MARGSAGSPQRALGAAVAVGVLALALGARGATAQVVTAFTSRFSTNDTGDILIASNTLLTCPANASGCTAGLLGNGSAVNNNSFNMVVVDVDADAATFNSSRATLTVPAGATVLFAGLYWGADTTAGSNGSAAPTPANRNAVRFDTPATPTYVTVTGSVIGTSTLNGSDYHAFADVTALVQTGGTGLYTVANVQAGTGVDHNAGWALVVAIRDPAQALRNLTVFDGFAAVTTSVPSVTISVSGFLTPAAGTVNTRIGVVSYEGDVGLTGDNMRLNSTQLGDALNPTTNFFNSSITRLGSRVTAKSPDYVNQLGFDADIVDASGILTNSSMSASITLNTDGDFYYPGVVTFATEIFAPAVTADKTQADLNGGNLIPGDVIEYTLGLKNVGQDPATNVVLRDIIPANTTYQPGSLVVVTGANAGAKSDPSGNDQAEFDSVNNRVVFRLGTGATAAAGGSLAVNAATSVRFRVVVNALAANGAAVSNSASASYNGATLGGSFTGASQSVGLTVAASPILAASKTASIFTDTAPLGVPSPGDVLQYTVQLSNSGSGAATGIVFADAPGANTALVPGSVTTSQGSVTTGNGGGDIAVSVNVGTILAGGGPVTITFRAAIASPAPPGVTQVSNQGTVSSAQLPTVLTDDPAVGGNSDPTVSSLIANALVSAAKTAALAVDPDADGPSPGDTLEYQISIANSGNTAATGAVFTDAIPANTVYVPGSTRLNGGGVADVGGQMPFAGGAPVNSPGEPSGQINAGENAVVTFRVTVNDPLAAGVTNISNQGAVSGNGFTALLTDDPGPGGTADPTVTAVTAAPSLSAEKTATLVDDAGADGAGPGDTLLYQVTLRNTGNQLLTNLAFNDSPGANLELVPGSVQTNQGTVLSGNAGTAPIIVQIGALARGSSVVVSFRATVSSPLPPGVTQVSNQGSVTGSQLPALLTDDPAAGGPSNPTITAVTAAPLLAANKSATLVDDADGSGAPSPGDTLLYTVAVTNNGNGAATAVAFTDTPDANTALVPGSVSVSQGSVTGGNGGTPPVTANLGTLPGGGASATISFRVVIAAVLPANVSTVSNQGTVTSAELPALPTNDPSTQAGGDPTTSSVTAAPSIALSKTVVLSSDADADGLPSPGDTLLYQVTARNAGNQAATGLTLSDIIDPNTALEVGSVSTSQGTVTTGNAFGDTAVAVGIGDLGGGGASASISFRAVINAPLPAGVSAVSNQATVSGTNFPSVSSDDPATPAAGDPTVTAVTSAPALHAAKIDLLFNDADGDGTPSPNDTVLYTVTISNTGNGAATSVVFNDVPDPDTTLVPGSVQSSQGMVTGGNGGTPPVTVALGTIPGGNSSVTVSFSVLINDPLADGVDVLRNQGAITSAELPSVLTDDPDSNAPTDPTTTVVAAAPRISATKVDILDVDADGDGLPSPGDTLLYQVNIRNDGNQAATASFVDDVIDPNSGLVVGSVLTTQGTVLSGNTGGDSAVNVDIGTLPGRGGNATITFRVTIDDPLAPGVLQVSNQAQVRSADFPTVLTDDPSTQPLGDPTTTSVTAAPGGRADKTVTLLNDADGDGVASPGDSLLYVVTVLNSGNGAATNASMTDTPDPNTTLINGSVQTSQGTITLGNGMGDSSVAITVGTIPPRGGTFTASFQVTINNPLPPGVTQVTNQAMGTSTEIPIVKSDDPTLPGPLDPTSIGVSSAAVLSANKTASLAVDADGNGTPSPGDTLLYTVTITNGGNGSATGVMFTDTPPALTSIVPGTVQSTRGMVTGGNGGTPPITVDIGTLPGGGANAVITFQAQIAASVPFGVVEVVNQGSVTSDQSGVFATHDPSQPGTAAPTRTALTSSPVLTASKSWTLETDTGDPGSSPGDTLEYTVIISNVGNQTAANVAFSDTPGANTTLVPGTVLAVGGSVDSGNGGTDTAVAVSAATLTAGSSITVTFQVVVAGSLPAGVDQVSNQGLVNASGLPVLLTDDPAVGGPSDPTVTPVTARPLLVVEKSDLLFTDADGNGSPSPGDTLSYAVLVRNNGNSAAANVVVTDAPDPNTLLVSGSVSAPGGLITSGNAVGDTVAAARFAMLPGGMTASVTFRVVINSPLGADVLAVANQASVESTQLGAVLSDDPDTPAAGDPTLTPVAAAPLIRASKSASLLVDVAADGVPGPGDTLVYQIVVRNDGNRSGIAASLNDLIDPSTTLVAGSVNTTQGVVTSGNGPTDTAVAVTLGTLAGGGSSATLSFQVVVADPLAAAVTQVANQAQISGGNFPSVFSDDPLTPAVNDPTITAVTVAPRLEASKTVLLVSDADGDGVTTAGDDLLYQITVRNRGNSAITNVTFSDTPDANTVPVSGSVQTTQGTVTSGNGGAPPIAVDIGTLPIGAAVNISFRVRISDPVAPGTTQVVNQGVVNSQQLPVVLTDDPTLGGTADPTVTGISANPLVQVAKTAVLAADRDNDGVPSPGDSLLYEITARNIGNVSATGLTITDSLDAALLLEVGSVTTSLGAVNSGNAMGDVSVRVDLSALGRNAAVTVSFRVEIADPLPPGVNQVSNQAVVTGTNFPSTNSDDPSTQQSNDPTLTPVTAAPAGFAHKRDVLFTDADMSGGPSPGDTLLYIVEVVNTGNGAATNANLVDVPDPSTALVVGSVQTSQGTITSGNNPMDSSVAISIGTIPGGGGSFTASFRVTINSPLPPGVTQISNQAIGTSTEIPAVVTDDPDSAAPNDPTMTVVVAGPVLNADKSDALAIDADGNGVPSPGDTISYTLQITNTGNGGATGVTVIDSPDLNSNLVVGSVQTTFGSVTVGNMPGDTSVAVSIGNLPGAGASATVSFSVVIDDPLAPGVNQLANQAAITANEVPDFVSNDPGTPQGSDPTLTVVSAFPAGRAEKTASLFNDADGNGVPSPGDTLLYIVHVVNTGNGAGTNAMMTDTPGANTALVPGTVQTSQGTITSGNGPMDTSVAITIGTIPARGGTFTASFQVTISGSLPAGVTQVSNQAFGKSDQIPFVQSDDPTTPSGSDPTVTSVASAPRLTASKTDVLFDDADGSGGPSPGDVLLYQVVVSNDGNADASTVAFNDTPGANTTLVVGSVQTSLGSVTSGNAMGQTSVGVSLGTLGGLGGSATISFKARINNPIAANVTSVSNQGSVSKAGSEPPIATDDPTTPSAADPTRTQLVAGALSGRIFNDADGDGVIDAGENGLAGVPVSLIWAGPNGMFADADDVSYPAQVSAGDGSYTFAGLPAGQFQIVVDPSGLPAGFLSTTGGDDRVVPLAAGEVRSGANFGYAGPDVLIEKRHDGAFRIGAASGEYQITVRNLGPVPTSSTITVVDTLPAGLAYAFFSGSGWTCNAVAQVVTCTLPTPLAAGASTQLRISVDVLPSSDKVVINQATVSISGDTNGANNTALDSTAVFTEPAPAPALSPLALLVAGLFLALIARRAMRRSVS